MNIQHGSSGDSVLITLPIKFIPSKQFRSQNILPTLTGVQTVETFKHFKHSRYLVEGGADLWLCVISSRLCEPGVFVDAADCSLSPPLMLLTSTAFKA